MKGKAALGSGSPGREGIQGLTVRPGGLQHHV